MSIGLLNRFCLLILTCIATSSRAQTILRSHEIALKLLPLGLAYEWHGLEDFSIEVGFTSERENVSFPNPDMPYGVELFRNGEIETHIFISAKRYYSMGARRSLYYGVNLNARFEHSRTEEVKAYYQSVLGGRLENGYVYGPGLTLGYAHLIRQRIIAGLDIYSFLALNNNYHWEGILYHLRLAYRI